MPDDELEGQQSEGGQSDGDAGQQQGSQQIAPGAGAVAPDPQRMVPLNALHEARAEIKNLRDSLQSTSSQLEGLNKVKEDFNQFRKAFQQGMQGPQKTFDQDPLGFTRDKLNEYGQTLEEMRMQTQQQNVQQQQMMQQQQAMNAIQERVASSEKEFVAKSPDYFDAIGYLQQVRTNELEAMGINNPMAIQQHIQNSAIQLAMGALQNGKSPAEVAYSIALKYGYKPSPGGLDSVQFGMNNANRNFRGSSPDVNPTFENLLKITDDAEFEAAWNKVFKEAIK